MAAKLKTIPKQTLPSYNIFMQHHKKSTNKKFSTHKKIIQKIIHPDYILFDWEFFSRDLEFE